MRANDDLVDYLDLDALPFLEKHLPITFVAMGIWILTYSPTLVTAGVITVFLVLNLVISKVSKYLGRERFHSTEMLKFNASILLVISAQIYDPKAPFWMLNIIYLFRVAVLYRNKTQRVVFAASLALLPTYALLFVGESLIHAIRPFLVIAGVGFLVNAVYEFLKRNIIEKVGRLREIESRYSKLYNSSSEMRLSVDARTGKIVDCNQKLVTTLGFKSRDEILGKDNSFIHHPASVENAKALFRMFQTQGHVENWEMILAGPNGKKIFALINVSPIRDTRGKLTHSSSYLTDITDLKNAENKLNQLNSRLQQEVDAQVKGVQEQKEFLTKLVDSLPLAMFAKDYSGGSGRFLLWNETAESYWGVSSKQVLGKKARDFMEKGLAEKFTQADLKSMSENRIIFEEQDEIQTVYGKRVMSSWRVPVSDSEGKPRFLLGLYQDITEKVELETQLEMQKAVALNASKMATLGEMAGGIAHEINNPLAIIKGNLYRLGKVIAKEQDLDLEKARKAIAVANSTVERITSIVDGLRNFSRDDSNEPFIETPICDVIEDAIGFCRERFKVEGIELKWDDNGYKHITVECRQIQVSQVLINLINNARAAIEDLSGDKWVKISIDELDSYIAINIIDAGSGIEKSIREKLFRPFFTTKAIGLGTGLGLSISKGIVEIHGGRLFLDEDCQNTKFVILMPKTQAVVAAA